MKRSQLFIAGCLMFCTCCGMSKCNLDNPGPITTVHGVVTDGATGKPIPNFPLEVVDAQHTFNPQSKDYESVVTDATEIFH